MGLLEHPSQFVRPSRVFLRRLYNLLAQINFFKPHHSVRLNAEAQADRMVVNVSFLVEWYLHLSAFDPDIEVWSDVSGSWCSIAFALVASSVRVSVDRVVCQGVLSDCGGSSNLGCRMVGFHGMLLL